jgi:hypothetical protein
LDSNLKNKKLFVEGAIFSSEPTKHLKTVQTEEHPTKE